jgi:hypothetical protein
LLKISYLQKGLAMQQQSIEERAIQTYQDNLLFLQEKQPALFEKIDSLNLAIEKGFYKERLSLEYKEDGYFDVLDMETNKYLYGSNSIEYGKSAAKSVNFEKKENLFETFYNVYISPQDAKSYENAPITDSSYSASAEIISYANEHAQKPDAKMKKLYKYIFFGTGLGTHLPYIHQKLNANVYFIVEQNLELFRLSLFVTNYRFLTGNGAILYFSVFDEYDEFIENAKRFFNEMFIYNQYLKYFAMLNFPDERIKDFQKFILGQGYLVFNYSAMTLSIIRPLEHLKEHYKLLNISARLLENSQAKEKPFLILGAGPSLHKNIEWLQKNQEKFVIVAVSAMLSTLEEHNIKPAIITHTHGFDDALPHVQKVKNMDFFDDTILLFSTFTTPKFLSYFKKENIFLFQGTSTFKERFSGLGSSNIGALTYGLITKFGVKNIYLLGLDFALDQETGASHSASHSYVKQLDTNKTEYELEEDINYIDSAMITKGNFQEKVKTNLIFDGFKKQCELFNKIFPVENSITYNLSDGAFIEGTQPLQPTSKHIQQLPKLYIKTILQEIRSIFLNNSEDYLTNEDIEVLKNKLNYVKSIKKTIDAYAQKKYSSMEKFHHGVLGLFLDILGEDKNKDALEINNVFEYYLKYISGYIFDLINTEGLKNEKHHIKQINKILTSQLRKIIDFYENFYEEYLEEMQHTTK